jgi:hypothetical protein
VTELVGFEGAGHDLFRTPGRSGVDVAAEISAAFLAFTERAGGERV